MIDGMLNTVLLYVGVYNPTILSQGYTLLSAIMWGSFFRRSLVSSLIYKLVIIYSVLVLAAKLLLLTMYWINSSLSVFSNKSLFTLFGIALAKSFNYEMFMNFYPEIVGIIVSILGILYRKRLQSNPQNLIRRSIMGIIVIFNLLIASLSYYSAANTVYFIMLIIWIAFWGYRVNERFLLHGVGFLSFLVFGQISFTGLYNLLLKDSLSENLSIKLGILSMRQDSIFCFISTFLLFFTSASFTRRLVVRFNYSFISENRFDSVPLVRRGTQGDELPTFFNQIMTYLSFTLIYGICVFNVFLWIANFNGYMHLLMLSWLFYSIIEKSMQRLMVVTRNFFIPILFIDCVFFYVYNLIDLETGFFIGDYKKEYSVFYVFYEIWTISMFLLLQRRIRKKEYDQHASSITTNLAIGVLLENSNKVSLIVVFLIGLSRINVFHLGFMAIFLVFILKSDVSKKYWIVLVYYTQFTLLTIYTVIILKESGANLGSDEALTIIGFETRGMELVAGIFPKDYLVWMLLLSAAMQLSAYRSSYVRDRKEALKTGTKSKVIVIFSKIYQWMLFLFIWIVYIALFLAINMSSLNLINFGRYLVLIVLFAMHVFETSQLLIENFVKVDKHWNLLTYYSGAVLVVRYLYQFFTFVPGMNFGSDFVGIKIYDDGALYENMATDCVILLMVEYQKARTSINRQGHMMSVDFLENFSVTELIRKKTITPSSSFNWIKEIGAKYYVYFYTMVIVITAILWRISVSMIVYLLSICVFFVYVEKHMEVCAKEKRLKSMALLTKYRINLYKWLMIETIIYMILSYCAFMFKKVVLTVNYDDCRWAYFVMGFSIPDNDFLLVENYIYLMILILLTFERHFLDGIQGEFAPDPTPVSDKLGLVVKILAESFTPSVVLAIGFFKITFVTIFNSLAVIISICLRPQQRVRFLYYCLFSISFLQYLFLLVNLSSYDSPYDTPDYAPDPLWMQFFKNSDSDLLTYLNLGNKIYQTYGLSIDFLFFVLLGVYYSMFSLAPSEISDILHKSNLMIMKKQTSCKEIFYSSVHFFILFIVLIFISESSGFFSLCYCMFCLMAIFIATKVLKSKATFYRYLKLLKHFLIPLMCFEMLSQSIYQLPIHGYLSETTENWLNVVGFAQLWSGGGKAPKNVNDKFKRIYFKSFTLGFILLAYWLMTTRDYGLFIDKLSAKYRVTAKKIGLEMAQAFNNSRLKVLRKQEILKIRTDKELQKLEENVKKWNEKFNSTRYNEAASEEKIENISDYYNLNEELKKKYKPGLKRKFQDYMLNMINPVIFKHFLCRIKIKKNQAIKDDEDMERYEKRKSDEESKSQSISDDDEKGLGKDFDRENAKIASFVSVLGNNEKEVYIDKLKRKQYPYILNYRDWLKISMYVICSSTQGLVFLCFLLNHFYYASLESLIFPISVLCYGILSYPRPSPNFFRIMLIYTEFIFLIKFVINLYIWDFLGSHYTDTAKIGFNFAKSTYSETLTPYIILDAICILVTLGHEYFLIRCGLNDHIESEIESLEQAEMRRITDPHSTKFRKSLLLLTEMIPKKTFGIQIKDFLSKIGGGSNDEKPGRDYYTRTVLVQLFILIFILFFFSQMTGEISNFSNVFVANTFPGSLVIALMLQSGVMFLDRYLYLDFTSKSETFIENERNLKMKFWIHIVLVFSIHVLIFWYFTINGNIIKNGNPECDKMYNSFKCNNFQINSALQMFYFLYLVYFIISAYQIKYGAPKTRAGEFVLTKKYNSLNNIIFLIYRGMPFLYEIRTLLDWTFTPTALNLMQWFKFEEIYASLYNTKCDQIEFAEHPRGSKRKKLEKIFKGCCFLLLIILCILAPLIIFSSLNPIVFSNPVKEISFSVGVKTSNSNFYDLSTVSIINKKESVSTHEWDSEKFSEANDLSASDRSLMEKITLSPYSDNYWEASQNLIDSLCKILYKQNSGISIQAKYVFTREYPSTQQTVTSKDSSNLSPGEIDDLHSIFCNSSNPLMSFTKSYAFAKVIRLVSTGASLLPTFITGSDNLKTDIQLKYHDKNNMKFWELNKSSNSSLSLYIISEKYSPVTFNFSVITFYISVVYLIGKILRIIISGGANNIPLIDMPNPDPFINVCTGIYVSRMTGDLYREESLFYDLIDMLRSPELMKMLSGSSSIKKKD